MRKIVKKVMQINSDMDEYREIWDGTDEPLMMHPDALKLAKKRQSMLGHIRRKP